MEHTKGLWIIDDSDIGIEKFCSGDRIFIPICTTHVPGLYNTTEAIIEEQYNQKLIAAAPELYEACDPDLLLRAAKCLEDLGLKYNGIVMALKGMAQLQQSALAKAEGKSDE